MKILIILHHHVAIPFLVDQLPLHGRQVEQHLLEMRPTEEVHPRASALGVTPIGDQPFDLLHTDATQTATLHGVCGEFHSPAPLSDFNPRPASLFIHNRLALPLPHPVDTSSGYVVILDTLTMGTCFHWLRDHGREEKQTTPDRTPPL